MPPSASWNLPMRLSTAPVKAPFSWPNRIDSTRFSGMAPQLTVTNGLPARPLSPWMARAISSLPTPDSPSIRTAMLAFDAAARRPSEMTRGMAVPRMTRSLKVSVPSTFFLMRVISTASASILSALLIDTSSRSGLAGLITKSTAPARMALMAVSIEPCAVCTMIGGMPTFWLNRSSTVMPSVSGITRSRRTREMEPLSGDSRIWMACSPPCAVRVSKPRRLIISSRMRRWAGSSSTIRTRLAMGTELDATGLIHASGDATGPNGSGLNNRLRIAHLQGARVHQMGKWIVSEHPPGVAF